MDDELPEPVYDRQKDNDYQCLAHPLREALNILFSVTADHGARFQIWVCPIGAIVARYATKEGCRRGLSRVLV